MSAGISSCCTPCAAAPVAAQPETTGGGEVIAAPETVAPEPTPEAGAQPAAPATVTGGGDVSGGGGTCYQPAPEPVQCGQWVPAPVATGPVAPTTNPTAPTTGPDTPPDPIAGPDGSTGETTLEATGPASALSTWPDWQQYFSRLGVSQTEIAKIGAASLSNEQLAEVYENIHSSIVASGGTPGTTPIPAANAWNSEWEQKFAALGLPAEFVAELKAEALRTGADAAKLEAVYQDLVAKGPGAVSGTSAWSAEWEQKFAALGLPTEFIAQLKAQAEAEGADAAKLEAVYQQLVQQTGGQQGTNGTNGANGQQQEGPGWNAQIEQAFRSLGMPDEVLKLYAESGAPISGLEAAYKHAAGRVEDFTQRGWMQKFTEAGVDPMQTWGAILGDQPITDDAAQELLDAHVKSTQSIWQKGGQLATSLFPGGRLLQYAFGKEFVSGEKIDRTDWKEIGFAALSGLSTFAAIRGAKTIGAGWAARNGGFTALNGVNETLAGLKTASGAAVPLGEVEAVSQAAMGATATWGLKQKLMSLIPGTTLHKEIVGLGHAEAAARAFNAGGAAKMLANDADGALQLASITKLFDDIKSGTTRIHGGALAYLGPFKSGPIMSLDAVKGGGEVIKVAKNLKIGNGNSQLVGLMEVAGTKLGRNPDWLTNAVNLTDDIAALSAQQRQTLGSVMAGSLARDLGGFTKDGLRPMRYVAGLQNAHQPEWYANLANATKAQWPNGAKTMPQDLFAALANHRVFTGMFDEGSAVIAGIDRSTLSPESVQLLDDLIAKTDESRAAFEAVKAGGKLTDEVGLAHENWVGALGRFHEAEPELAMQAFGKYIQPDDWAMAQTAAGDAVRSEWLAANADDVAEALLANADDAAETVAASADEVVEASAGVRTVAAPAAAAADTVEGAAVATGGGSTIGSTWQPGTTDRKFTGSVSEFIAEAQRPRPVVRTAAPAPVAEVATPAAVADAVEATRPITMSVNARGERVTGSGLIIPSYASPAGAAIPTDVNDPSIARLAEAMQRMHA